MRKKYDVSVIQLPFSNIVSVKKPLKKTVEICVRSSYENKIQNVKESTKCYK